MARETVLEAADVESEQVRALQNQDSKTSSKDRAQEAHQHQEELSKWDRRVDRHSTSHQVTVAQSPSSAITQMSRHKITIRQKLSGNINEKAFRRETQAIVS